MCYNIHKTKGFFKFCAKIIKINMDVKRRLTKRGGSPPLLNTLFI